MNTESDCNTDSSPLLTIAIPTYNGSKTIRDAFNSILLQYDERVELLISDNCSNDETSKIIEEYVNRFKFIKVVRNENNIGPDANFLNCLRLSSGKFILLMSDDDVLIEDSLAPIVHFLVKHPDVSLVYLYTIGFRKKYINKLKGIDAPVKLDKDIYTPDRKVFMKYAGCYWGFMSSFICSREKFKLIENPEKYFGTFWLQSYIHILCTIQSDTKFGLIKGPCIGAGRYVNISNFDPAVVNGIYYRKMLDFAVKNAYYDKKQLDELYIWRLCHLGKRDIIKERAAGIKKTGIRTMIRCSWRYPRAWFTLYPIFLIPGFICRIIMMLYKKKEKLSEDIRINRPE